MKFLLQVIWCPHQKMEAEGCACYRHMKNSVLNSGAPVKKQETYIIAVVGCIRVNKTNRQIINYYKSLVGILLNSASNDMPVS